MATRKKATAAGKEKAVRPPEKAVRPPLKTKKPKTAFSQVNLDLSPELIEEWYEAEDETEEIVQASASDLEQKYADTQVRVVRSTMDFTLHHLQSSLRESNYINLAPEYQRRARWDRKKKSLLIESILLNVPIPSLFLFETDYNQYEVMDGRQRLETITEFLDNGFSLSGLEYWRELHGKRYRDLPLAIQRGLLRRTISAVVLLAETAKGDGDFDIRMVLFRRLNTGGIKLNPQELRNAAHPGRFNDLLKTLSRHDDFTSLWGIPKHTPSEESDPPAQLLKNVLYQTMMDCELVLRFFGIRETVADRLKGSLRHILDRTMDQYRTISENDAETLRFEFASSLQLLKSALGDNFIVLPQTNRPSRPLWDALMVAVSLIDAQSKKTLANRQAKIMKALSAALGVQDTYDKLVGRGNTVEAIKDRVQLAKRILST